MRLVFNARIKNSVGNKYAFCTIHKRCVHKSMDVHSFLEVALLDFVFFARIAITILDWSTT